MVEFIVDLEGNVVWKDKKFTEIFGEKKKCYELIHGLGERPSFCPALKNAEKASFCEYVGEERIFEVTRIELDGRVYYYHKMKSLKEAISDFVECEFISNKAGVGYALVVDNEIIRSHNCEAKSYEEIKSKYKLLAEMRCYYGDRIGKVLVFSKEDTLTSKVDEVFEILRVIENSEVIGMLIYQDDYFVYVNKGAENITGYTKDELMSKPFWEFAHESVRDVVKERGKRRQRGENVEPRLYVVPIYTKAGDVKFGLFWFDSIIYNGKPAGVTLFFDITERVESEELFKSLFFSSPIGQYILVDGKFELVNSTFEKLTGYTTEELRNKYWFELVHEEDREKVRKCAIEMLKGLRKEPYEYRAIRKDGKVKWILESVVSIRYKGKRAVLGNFVDITERKELEEMNEKLLEYTTHLNRMLRHDLKNVLSAISLSSELLRDSGVENKAVGLIERSIERGFEIIESAKETEEIIRTGKLKEINLKDVLARIGECFKDVEVNAEDVIILADDTIFNVLSNLIENAFKHGGAKKVRISVRKEDDFAVITVEDDGKGIPKEIREKIFDYGFSYGEKAGSGVGLYVVRRAVERWGGKISVGESELGGAKFIIKLGCVECLQKKPF